MKENKVCRVCGVPLVVGENTTQNIVDHHDYLCRACRSAHLREFRRRRVQSCATCENKVCIKCGDPLVIGENVTQSLISYHYCVCSKCMAAHRLDYNHRTGRTQPMSEKRDCPMFLGVHVAERVLSHVFDGVKRMPYNNPGYDFRCGRGYLVDVKSSCRQKRCYHADQWRFGINKNQIAEYFLCLAFDNRDDLTPEHIWLIPTENVNEQVTVSIAETRLDKWKEYELPIDQVVSCCNTMRRL